MHEEVVKHIKSYQELLGLDFTPVQLRKMLGSGRISRVARGTYTSQMKMSPQEEHLALAMACSNRRAELVLSHQSAAIAWGLAVLNIPEQVNIRARKGSHSPYLKTHQDGPTLRASTALTPSGLHAVVPLDTVLACARSCSKDEAVIIADSALYQGYLGYQQLYDELYLVKNQGRRKARIVADSMATHVMSPGETLLRLRLNEFGLFPIVQCPVPTGTRTFHGDLGLPEHKIILEFDGKVKYSGAYGDPHTVLAQEKERMDAILNAGWRIIRVDWKMVQKPARRLKTVLEAHGLLL